MGACIQRGDGVDLRSDVRSIRGGGYHVGGSEDDELRNNTIVSLPCFLTFFSILDELFFLSSLELHCYKKKKEPCAHVQPFPLRGVGMLLLY